MEYKDVTDVIAGLHGVLDRVERKVTGSWVHRAFWHKVEVKWYTPPVLLSRSIEIDEPFRRSRTVVLRYWWDKCLVLGFWGKTEYDEDANLLEATIHGRERTHDERIAYDEARAFDSDPRVEGLRGPVLEGRSRLRVRASTDAGIDG